ncbi:glycosyltransferase family 2 protein [Stenotrophomonas sp. YAU14A_MKIMI4_1]|uniref:glycosyltransferase family 2 protein n=1 Tax=Stenotrophomonas sp. YAU14A_MKIMI4_1 TaxID=2072408 RepID=UPI000D53C710|nr:glycosyltransferase family 2 protein [Stenotrophomonas sp. YAU14A_MKIMI4_1]AWH27962.1 glycosyltransferase [Stenotrophomonas sp. YAU14A_MKIMI4_1]
MNPEISVVIPVYGSASILPSLVQKLEQSLSAVAGPGGFEAVLVHDHGPDNSWEVLKALAADRPWLKGINLRRNAGQHNAVMAGFAHARGRYIITMDDDLQHDPNDIPRIVEALEAGADLVYVRFEARQHALWKRLGSRFNDWVASRLLNKPTGLYLSPFRGIRREVCQTALGYRGPFVYVDGLLLQSTSNFSSITARHHLRQDGKSGYSLRKSIALWMQMATSFSIVPLRFVSLAGIAASGAAFLFALIVVARKLMNPDLAVGWSSLIVAILFMGGLQLLALGAIGEYTGRILLNVNNRPQFVVGERCNLDADPTIDS